mgnify:CR=1 FL=1
MDMEDNGYKYLFGYYSNEEKIWYVQPRRFVLLKDKNNVKSAKINLNLKIILQLYKNKTTDYETLKTILHTTYCWIASECLWCAFHWK